MKFFNAIVSVIIGANGFIHLLNVHRNPMSLIMVMTSLAWFVYLYSVVKEEKIREEENKAIEEEAIAEFYRQNDELDRKIHSAEMFEEYLKME